jgi:hypothetical protein
MPDTNRDLYGVGSAPFVRHFRKQVRANRQQIRRWYKSPIIRIERILDLHYAFACQHVWTFSVTRSDPTALEKLQFSAVHKNHLALFAISEMTQAGFFGPVRPLLRQVFEAQLIAKFAVVAEDWLVAAKWADDKHIPIPRMILSRIQRPSVRPLTDFWNVLHRYVHASPSSQQVSLYADDNKGEIGLDLMFMTLLVHNQTHFLTQHAFSEASRRIAARYGSVTAIRNIRLKLRSLLAANRIHFSDEGKALVRAYQARWTIESPSVA